MAMTKAERDQLLQLVKKREKVMKTKAQERSAVLLAEFDAQSAKIHHYDEDDVWRRAQEEAQAAVEKARTTIAARCQKLGIPAEFAPDMQVYWHGRGQNAVAERRAELRRAAQSRIQAIEKEALSKIESMSLEAQTEIVAHGLESDAAKAFLHEMPKLEALMPPVQVAEIQSLIEAQRTSRRRYLDHLQ